MHDTYCHVDQHKEPENLCRELEAKEIYTIAVTNLPSHYALTLAPLKNFKYVRPALGLHPLLASRHAAELTAFERLSRSAELIGEVGLDFSPAGIKTKELQIQSFRHVLKCLRGRPRFISLHSRRAEDAVLAELRNFSMGPAVFHWFTGSAKSCESALSAGHFFSVNISMLASAKGKSFVEKLPRERVLTESDFPHVRVNGASVGPLEIQRVISALAALWKVPFAEACSQLHRNLQSADAGLFNS